MDDKEVNFAACDDISDFLLQVQISFISRNVC